MVQVLYHFDEGFVDCTLVSACSLIRRASRPLRVVLSHCGVSAEAEDRLHRFAAHFAGQVWVVRLDTTLPAVTRSHITSAALGRLKALELFDGRVLYLDGDTLVRKDITPLFRIDLHDNPLAAAPCPTHLSWWFKSRSRWRPGHRRNSALVARRLRELGRDSLRDYVNSGVLLVDTDRMRTLGLMDRLADMEQAASYRWHDQDHINVVLAGRIEFLDGRFNAVWGNDRLLTPVIPRDLRQAALRARNDPTIVHFAGKQKPWRPDKWSWGTRLRDRLFRPHRTAFCRAFWEDAGVLEADAGITVFPGVPRPGSSARARGVPR